MQKIKNNSLIIVFLALAITLCSSVAFAKAQNENQVNNTEHKSTVATFVKSLLNVADREQGGIGEQVRVIAQAQNDSEATTSQAIATVEARSKITTFLLGSDYKNLGALRSEMVTTQNRINQLNNLLPNIQNASDTAEVQAQIQILQQEQTNINNFIQVQGSKFSLFGWLVKMFNK